MNGWMEGCVCTLYIQMNGKIDEWMNARMCVYIIYR